MSKSCQECYWNWCRLIGCPDAERGCVCADYYPNDIDEEFSAPEPDYDVKIGGAWGRLGFSVTVVATDED